MRQPQVDYRKLRPGNLASPEYRHLLLLLGWVGYLIAYVLTEDLIDAARCYPVHCALDDRIPFQEWFILPYCAWYFLILGTLLWFVLYDIPLFKKLQIYLITTQVVAVIVYVAFPTRQDLRPAVFPRDNTLTDLVRVLYRVDTNTGVCPSLHVAYALGILSAWLRERAAGWRFKTCIALLVLTICVSVTFVKQHSVIDIAAALPVCALAEWIAFWRKRGTPFPGI